MHPQNKEGAIAQLVEQRTENPCVTGSIPVGTTKTEEREILIPIWNQDFFASRIYNNYRMIVYFVRILYRFDSN